MQRDVETIYAYLIVKVMEPLRGTIDAEAATDLDGALWACAHALCDENSGNTTGVCAMQNKVLKLAENIVHSLSAEDRHAAIDALDIARVLMRKNISDAQSSPQVSELRIRSKSQR